MPQRTPNQRRLVRILEPQEQFWWQIPAFQWRDPYHWIITLSWPLFLLFMGLLYFVSNAIFALAYILQAGSISNAQPGSFWDAFFFSTQTLSTIGYGVCAPQTLYAQGLVALESWVGLLGFALVTGLMFARFALPRARVLFSNVVVICPFNGVPTLMFRVANQRGNRLLAAQVRVSMLRHEATLEGQQMYRLYDLKLSRSRTPSFGLTWMVMHPINAKSPFYQQSPEQLEAEAIQLFVTLTGLDETVSQTIHAYHIYQAVQFRWNARFADILISTTQGRRYIDYDRFHTIEPLPSWESEISASLSQTASPQNPAQVSSLESAL
jgi:inward rectifier potassium channel